MSIAYVMPEMSEKQLLAFNEVMWTDLCIPLHHYQVTKNNAKALISKFQWN